MAASAPADVLQSLCEDSSPGNFGTGDIRTITTSHTSISSHQIILYVGDCFGFITTIK